MILPFLHKHSWRVILMPDLDKFNRAMLTSEGRSYSFLEAVKTVEWCPCGKERDYDPDDPYKWTLIG